MRTRLEELDKLLEDRELAFERMLEDTCQDREKYSALVRLKQDIVKYETEKDRILRR